jgi:hypothetical protein
VQTPGTAIVFTREERVNADVLRQIDAHRKGSKPSSDGCIIS